MTGAGDAGRPRPRERHRPDQSFKRFHEGKIRRATRLAERLAEDPAAVDAINRCREEKAKRRERDQAAHADIMHRVEAILAADANRLSPLLVGKLDPDKREDDGPARRPVAHVSTGRPRGRPRKHYPKPDVS